MKTKIYSKFMILGFAFLGLFLVGNNVLGIVSMQKWQENTSNRSACNGQAGIERTDANDNCFCLHDPEPDSGNTCGKADSLSSTHKR
ncbi:MAG: hypothetical protein KGZ97_03465 [Bacteroidetes bacterium]|nr:hypothetical protein [Bacteroidota bacterium]